MVPQYRALREDKIIFLLFLHVFLSFCDLVKKEIDKM